MTACGAKRPSEQTRFLRGQCVHAQRIPTRDALDPRQILPHGAMHDFKFAIGQLPLQLLSLAPRCREPGCLLLACLEDHRHGLRVRRARPWRDRPPGMAGLGHSVADLPERDPASRRACDAHFVAHLGQRPPCRNALIASPPSGLDINRDRRASKGPAVLFCQAGLAPIRVHAPKVALSAIGTRSRPAID